MAEMKKPFVSAAVLGGIILICLLAGLFAPGDAARMDFDALQSPPDVSHLFGTDQMGRDMFGMILYGGRVSLFASLLPWRACQSITS